MSVSNLDWKNSWNKILSRITKKTDDLKIEKYKKRNNYPNYVEHLLILASTITGCGCVSLSVFSLLLFIPVGVTYSVWAIKICAIKAWIRKYKSIINKNEKKHDKIMLLGKDTWNAMKVLIYKALSESYISHDEFISVNNVLREYNEIKEKIKHPETSVEEAI